MKSTVFLITCILLKNGFTQECLVDNLNVTREFDFEKFMGTWYEVRRHSDVPSRFPVDHVHHSVQTGTGSATVYTQGRTSEDSGDCGSAISNLTVGDVQGKLQVSTSEGLSPFWVLETDYTQYAFVYGCHDVSSSGTCNGARAWIWSRTPSLSQNVLDKTSTFYQNICIEEGNFENVIFNKTCSVRTHWKLWDGQECSVDHFAVQENFEFTKYFSGAWFEMKWLAAAVYPPESLFRDYQHNYVIAEDGNVLGYAYGRSPVDMKCFYGDSIIQKTQVPGKLVYRPNDRHPSPYWVLRTDYTRYAVVYGCYNVSSDGSCYQARSWVWSRTPTLPKHLQYEANKVLQSICINPTAYLLTEIDELCHAKPLWNFAKEQDCNITRVASVVKESFNLVKMAGAWYEIGTVPRSSKTDHRLNVHADSRGHVTVKSRFREESSCRYTYSSYMKTDRLGLFTLSSSTGPFNFWVADTDYDTYAVVYECDKVGSDGVCLSPRGSVWSRTKTLAPQQQYRANSILQELCLNPAALVMLTQEYECPPENHIAPSAATIAFTSVGSTAISMTSSMLMFMYNV